MSDSLDNEAAVAGEVEEGATACTGNSLNLKLFITEGSGWFLTSVRSTILATQRLSSTSGGHAFEVIFERIFNIDIITSLFRKALALRPQGHSDHTLSLDRLIFALIWCYSKEQSAAYIQESAQLCCKRLPLCPEGTCLCSIGVDGAVKYVISLCSNLPIDGSDAGIHLQRVVLELSPMGHEFHPRALDQLAQAVEAYFDQHGSI
ncbi:hypothetical protein DEU56DRAFT_904935 [Suillus clintonianus]|uniref:uncharacterized protein n=1 Tax=Suillus clintonianus TaxID=1904413 RepID=UPI001B86A620|nr:uncharacterized protein DEU56DRAFT_904935 [Suillus clintonianus]KAG2118619.1 hypothetical protein DEU56DRAFT_904935 [Suillus clintonianus]